MLLNPLLSPAWIGQGQMHARAGRWAAASECFSQALATARDKVSSSRHHSSAIRASEGGSSGGGGSPLVSEEDGRGRLLAAGVGRYSCASLRRLKSALLSHGFAAGDLGSWKLSWRIRHFLVRAKMFD